MEKYSFSNKKLTSFRQQKIAIWTIKKECRSGSKP